MPKIAELNNENDAVIFTMGQINKLHKQGKLEEVVIAYKEKGRNVPGTLVHGSNPLIILGILSNLTSRLNIDIIQQQKIEYW